MGRDSARPSIVARPPSLGYGVALRATVTATEEGIDGLSERSDVTHNEMGFENERPAGVELCSPTTP